MIYHFFIHALFSPFLSLSLYSFLAFFVSYKLVLLVGLRKIKQQWFFILILAAVLLNQWERKVCIPVLMQMINSHTDCYMMQHCSCFNLLTHYLCAFAITFYYFSS